MLTRLRHLLAAARHDDRGSMPLALVMLVVVLILAGTASTIAAVQVVGNRSETTTRTASWALDSVLNQAAEQIVSLSFPAAGLPTEAPGTWTTSSDGSYSSRWWVTPGATDQSIVVVAQVKLAANPGAGIAADSGTFQAGASYLWNPVDLEWNITAYYPELEQ